jgi:hypothetical protein
MPFLGLKFTILEAKKAKNGFCVIEGSIKNV